MSRSGPYSLMLVAAVLLLLSVSPGALGMVLRAVGSAGADPDLASRIPLGSGALLVIASLIWVLRLPLKDSLRWSLVRERGRVAGRVDVSAAGLRCWADAGVLGLLRVELTLGVPTTMRMSLGSPGATTLVVLRQAVGALPAGWEAAARGAGWELRAAPGTQGRRVGEDEGAVSAQDALFSDPAALDVRPDPGGGEVEGAAVELQAVEDVVEVSFFVDSRLAQLNARRGLRS